MRGGAGGGLDGERRRLRAARRARLPRRLRHRPDRRLPHLHRPGRRPPRGASGLLPLAGAADHRGALPLGKDRHPRRAQPLDRDRRGGRDDHPAPDRDGQGRPLHDPHGGRHRRDRPDRLHPADGGDERPLERLLGLQRRRQRPPRRALDPLVPARLAPLHPDPARRLARPDQPQADADGTAADPPGEVAGRSRLRGRPGRDPAADSGADAAAAGGDDVGPAELRLAEHRRQPAGGLLARRQVRRLGRDRHLLEVRLRLRRRRALLQPLRQVAVRDRRVRALGQRRRRLVHRLASSAGPRRTTG